MVVVNVVKNGLSGCGQCGKNDGFGCCGECDENDGFSGCEECDKNERFSYCCKNDVLVVVINEAKKRVYWL